MASRPASGSHRTKSSTNLASRAGAASGFALSSIANAGGQSSGQSGNDGPAAGASSVSTASTAASGKPGMKRRQSVQTSASDEQHQRHHQHHAHTSGAGSSKIGMGARRKSKVNVTSMARNKSSSALAHHGSHHHHGHSTAMSRRDKSRSHTSLANLVSEMTQDAAETYHDRPAHARSRSSRSVSAGGSKGKRRSKDQDSHGQEEDDEFEDEEADEMQGEARANPDKPAAIEEDDASAGWISAASSKATTPDASQSPESPPPLQFGKKAKRVNAAKLAAVQDQQRLADEEAEGGRLRDEHRSSTVGFKLGSTPTQESNVQEHHNAPDVRHAAQASSEARIAEAGHDTPTIEKAESVYPAPEPQASSSQAPNVSPQRQTRSPTSVKSPLPPSEQAPQPSVTSDGLPQLPNINRPSNLRKSSTSTIRSLASTHTTRGPLAQGLRRQTAALQPRLDTKSEGLGEILEQGRSVTNSPTAMMSTPTVTVGDAHESPNKAGPSRHARQDSSGSRKTTGTTGSKAGTLTVQEAEDLARRLRSISGVGDAKGGLRRSVSTNNATLAQQQQGSQQQQRNRPSIPSFDPPLSASGPSQLGEKDRHDSSPMATLKRASGYFGSITRLAQLTGLTSTASTNTSPTSPQHGREHPSPPFSAGSGRTRPSAQQALMSSTQSHSARDTKTGGSSRGNTQVYQSPLISKFYDLNDRSPASAAVARNAYRPFRSYSAADPSSASTSSPHLSAGGVARGRMTPQYQPAPLNDIRSSRARQKMMTQRDAPYDPSDEPPYLTHAGSSSDLEGGGGGSGITSNSGSNLHLPTTPGEDGGASRSSSSARLNGSFSHSSALDPEIQRWLVTLAKDADKIDKDYACTERFSDPVGASMARVLQARKRKDEEERKREREERAHHSSTNTSGTHSPAGSALGHSHGQAGKGKLKPSGQVAAAPPTQRSKTAR